MPQLAASLLVTYLYIVRYGAKKAERTAVV